MRDQIKKRLAEYRTEALERIGIAVNKTKSRASGTGNLNSSRCYLAINEDNKAGFADYFMPGWPRAPCGSKSFA